MLRLTWRPERRWLLGVRLSGARGLWVGDVHLTGGRHGAATREARAAAAAMLRWADGAPAVLGGDFNVESLSLPGFSAAGGNGVDLIFAHGLDAVGQPQALDRGHLSDHTPALVRLR